MSAAGIGAGVRGQRLTILLGSRDHAGHHSLSTELLSRARKAGLAGATLLQGVEGRGRSGRLHRRHVVGEDAPVAIVIVDTPEKIEAFRDSLSSLGSTLVTVVDDVTAFRA